MNKLIYTVALILAITLTATLIPTESEAEIYTDTVRLHILANTDGDYDQELKYKVRDYVLKNYSDKLSGFENAENAKEELQALLPEIEESVDAYLKSEGASYSSRVTLSQEWYDTRAYDDFTLPRGVYYSLRVMLGEAEGKNWWCVMYPPMCLDLATEDAPRDDGILDYTKEEFTLITTGEYSVKFKLLELVSSAVRQLSKNG